MAGIYYKDNNSFTALCAADIDAASANHTHTNWYDINGGVLSLKQGGTGRSTIPDDSVIYKHDLQFKGLPVSEGVLMKDIATQTMSWQPCLPITAGGTGETSRFGVLSQAAETHKIPANSGSFVLNMGKMYLNGRLYDAKNGFRVLVPLSFSYSGGYTITFKAAIKVRQNGSYLFGSGASTDVAISNISGESNVFTGTITVTSKGYMGALEISAAHPTTQTAIGMLPINIEFSNFYLYFTVAT